MRKKARKGVKRDGFGEVANQKTSKWIWWNGFVSLNLMTPRSWWLMRRRIREWLWCVFRSHSLTSVSDWAIFYHIVVKSRRRERGKQRTVMPRRELELSLVLGLARRFECLMPRRMQKLPGHSACRLAQWSKKEGNRLRAPIIELQSMYATCKFNKLIIPSTQSSPPPAYRLPWLFRACSISRFR